MGLLAGKVVLPSCFLPRVLPKTAVFEGTLLRFSKGRITWASSRRLPGPLVLVGSCRVGRHEATCHPRLGGACEATGRVQRAGGGRRCRPTRQLIKHRYLRVTQIFTIFVNMKHLPSPILFLVLVFLTRVQGTAGLPGKGLCPDRLRCGPGFHPDPDPGHPARH